jgi:predicted PurR-regulated permease PerM
MPKFFASSSDDDIPEVALTISTATFVKILLLVVGAIVLLGLLHKAGHAMLLIFIAFFLALALNAPVSWLSRHLPGKLRGRRGLATALSTLIVVILLGAFVASLVPPITRQTSTLIHRAPDLIRNLRDSDSQVGKLINHYHLQGEINTISNQLSDRLKRAGGSAVSTLGTVTSSVFSVLTITVLTFMMLAEGPRWVDFGRRLLPSKRQAYADRLAADMYKVVRGFVNGQVLLAAIAAFLLLPGLLIFHVSYPIALMAVVFICGLIPMVGHTLGAITVALVALFHSPLSALGIFIYYIAYQQIENYGIQPRLQATATNMSPLLVFMSVVIGVSFSGLLGGLVAIPIAGCLRVLVLDYLHSRKLLAPVEVTSSTKQ